MSILEAAIEYHALGIPIVLCQGKKPLGRNWQHKGWTESEIKRAYQKHGELNFGCRWGLEAGMIDLECDSIEAEKTLLELFDGNPPVTATFSSPRGKHRLFKWHSDLERIAKGRIAYGGLDMLLGAGGKGAQSLLPPSVTSGYARDWLVPLDDCAPAPLPKAALRWLLSRYSSPSKAVDTETQEHRLLAPLCKRALTAIETTLPTDEGYRHRQIFRLAQRLKAIPEYANVDSAEIKSVLVEWHRMAQPIIGTKDFLETWADFVIAWKNVKYPAGQEPIRIHFEAAKRKPLPPIAERYIGSSSMQSLVALCAELQSVAGNKPFYLACRPAADLLEISHTQANKWLALLLHDKVIQVVIPGTRNRAAEYRYLG